MIGKIIANSTLVICIFASTAIIAQDKATLTTPSVRRLATFMILNMDDQDQKKHNIRFNRRLIVNMKVTRDPIDGVWFEQWTLDRCGVLQYPYDIVFKKLADGSTDVSIVRLID